MATLLDIRDLHTSFRSPNGIIDAVQGVTLAVRHGSTVALVGESGSGKSLTALSVMRLVPPPGFIKSGTITFKGKELTALSETEMRSIRGQDISMIFQDPMTCLNPVLRIGDQLTEPLIIHAGMSRSDAVLAATTLLSQVGIPSASSRLQDYPHQLSGGMRQRVMIAMALACKPSLLIADEPTTALDVTTQAQILELLEQLRVSIGLSILLITHDLGIVAEKSDHTCVMFSGRIVESAPTGVLLRNPRHPYTKALLSALPQNAVPGQMLVTGRSEKISPSPAHGGCGYCDRCPDLTKECLTELPPLHEIENGHFVCCWKCL